MARGSKPGERRGGRKKGTPNKSTTELAAMLEKRSVNPFEIMADIAAGNVDCATCRGVGKTKYQPAKGQMRLAERTCESCYGSGKEKVSPDLRGRMAAELGQYLQPKRKAIEHSGVGGGPIDHTVSLADVLAGRRLKWDNADAGGNPAS